MQPVAPLIRIALQSEIAELSQLIDAALAPFRGKVPDEVLRRYIAYARDIGGRWEDGEVWVAEVDGDIIGTVTLVNASSGGWASIQTLAVRPSMRGRGVGRRLIDHSIACARQRGVSEIRLVTGEFMIAARRLYESMGFSRCAERDFFASSYFANLKGSDVKILAYNLKLG